MLSSMCKLAMFSPKRGCAGHADITPALVTLNFKPLVIQQSSTKSSAAERIGCRGRNEARTAGPLSLPFKCIKRKPKFENYS